MRKPKRPERKPIEKRKSAPDTEVGKKLEDVLDDNMGVFSDLKSADWDTVCQTLDELRRALPIQSKVADSPYILHPSSSFSGGHDPCSHVDCRLHRLQDLVRFGVLYADALVLDDPLPYLEDSHRRSPLARREIEAVIQVLMTLMPVIREGLVRFLPTQFFLCDAHWKEFEALTSDYEGLVNKACEEICNDIAGVFDVEIAEQGICIIGPEEWVRDGGRWYYSLPPEHPLRDLARQSTVSARTKLIAETVLRVSVQDIVRSQSAGLFWNFSYLTDRSADSEILRRVRRDDGEINRDVFQALTHELPTLACLEVEDLLKLRRQEGEAFLLYRTAMTKIMRARPENVDVPEYIADTVAPQLAKIGAVAENARRVTKSNVRESAIISAGLIAAGLWAGTVADWGTLLAAVGGAGGTFSFLKNANAIFRENPDLRKNDLYFLWRAGQPKSRVPHVLGKNRL